MDSIAEGKLNDLLRNWLHYNPYDCGTILEQMTAVARSGGFDLDTRFAEAGLGAGPEAHVASRILARALLRAATKCPSTPSARKSTSGCVNIRAKAAEHRRPGRCRPEGGWLTRLAGGFLLTRASLYQETDPWPSSPTCPTSR